MRSDDDEIHRSVESHFELKSVDLRKSSESEVEYDFHVKSVDLRICESAVWVEFDAKWWPVLAEFDDYHFASTLVEVIGCNFSPKMYLGV